MDLEKIVFEQSEIIQQQTKSIQEQAKQIQLQSLQIEAQQQEIAVQRLEIQDLKKLLSDALSRITHLESELDTYQKRCTQYKEAYDALEIQYKALQRDRFGKKSERFVDTDSSDEDPLSDLDQHIKVASHLRKKSSDLKPDLPRRIEIIPVSDADRQCACGGCKRVIRYETKELIHHQSAIFEIIEQRREVVVCENGCDGSLCTAPAPLQVLPKSKSTPAFLAFLVTSKLEDRQPLYHLEKQLLDRYHLDCSRQTMARWVIELMHPMQPLFNLAKDYLIEYDIASCDATTLQVLKEPGRAAKTKSYVYCCRGGPPGKEVILYDYNYEAHQLFVQNWFEEFRGYLHVDGDNFFDFIGRVVQRVFCMAHARRKFEPIAQGAKGKGLAKEALRFFKELYSIERDAKNRKMTPEARFQLRQEKSKPLLEKCKAWLDEQYPLVLPQSPLGKAMTYCMKRWEGLTRFLDDGRLEMDNNLTEQEIKPFVMARKNFLFAASMDGARALCQHLSFIRTAKKHRVDPYRYYVCVLKRLPYCKTVEDYEQLLPWNIQLE